MGVKRKVVLVFVSHYLPGYKAGGPLKTIANMVESLGCEFDFFIITSDRDLGDLYPFDTISQNAWQKVGNANVYYTSPKNLTVKNFARIISSTPHDLLYLNSYFSSVFTIKPLLARRLYGAVNKPVVLAPRGEFSPGALAFKKIKKLVYLKVSELAGLYNDVVYHASSRYEADEINSVLNVSLEKIKIAPNVPKVTERHNVIQSDNANPKSDGVLKVLFLSRLTPKKNLDFALKTLALTKQKIQFDIYGPQENVEYWLQCQRLIDKLPDNVIANYCGSIVPCDVMATFLKYDIFLFPTHGENYGHVIAESLCAGTPVLISDQTPWKNLESDGLGWELPLDSPELFAEKIDQLASDPSDVREGKRDHIHKEATKRMLNPEIIAANRDVFYSVLRDVN